MLGSVGTDSGVVGAILAPLVEGAKVWAADVNSRGGLNGHPVRVIFGDDAGEPARAQALARRMVDQDHVVAFYQEHGPGTMQSVVPYLEEKKIPFIGSCQCTIPVAHSPIFFEVGPSGDHGVAWAHLGPLLAFSEKRKVSIMYCREAQTCPSIKDRLHEFASAAGINIVHEAQVSLAQPDYTAEVLAARNAGAEAILGAVDNSSVIRLARSAHRQDYYPEIVMQYTGHNETLPGFGGKDVEGILVSGSFPHWTSPKLADYRAAMARFGPKVPKASWSMTPYITGKLLELISKGFPENPTSADFLKGLYALNGETLGGIIPPLTFREGEGSDGNNLCIVPMKIENGNFNPKNGDNFTCLPGWAPPQK